MRLWSARGRAGSSTRTGAEAVPSSRTTLQLELPQVRVDLSLEEVFPCSCPPLLVLGGRAPHPEWLRSAASGREVWALDRGTDACWAAGVVPSRVLGDFDSVSGQAMAWAQTLGAAMDRYNPDKDDTDFQLALKRAAGAVLVTGCWGGRFDHAFSNVFSALSAQEHGVRVLCFADEQEVLFPLKGPARMELRLGTLPEALSLLPLTASCEGVSIANVKWPLEDAALLQAYPWAVSNVPLGGGSVSVRVRGGVLGVYVLHPRGGGSAG